MIDKIIKSKKFPPIIFFYGEEDFSLEEAYNKFIDSAVDRETANYNFEVLNGEETSEERIVNTALSFPFMTDRRVVVVKNFEKLFSGKKSKKDASKMLANYIANPMDTTILVLVSYSADIKKNLSKHPYNLLADKATLIEFPKVYDNKFPKWIMDRVHSFGKKITDEAANLIAVKAGSSIRELASEIDKLLVYAPDKDIYDKNDALEIVGSSKNYNVFELQKAFGERNLKKTLEMLTKMLAAERQEILIVSMVAKYFFTLLKLCEIPKGTSDFEIAKATGINAYFVKEYAVALTKFTPKEIENAIIRIADVDFALKSTSTDALFLLQKYAIETLGKINN